jgi:hypothetical protein
MREEIEEIQSVFNNLDIKVSPVEFYNQCRAVNYRPSVALDAIKEFALRMQFIGLNLSGFWNEFMNDLERMMGTLTKWKILDEKALLDFLEKDLLWLVGQNVLDDDDPFHLIKLRL